MTKTVARITRSAQAAKRREGKYLTFAFFERDGAMQLDVVGWTTFQLNGDNSGIVGTVHLWGHEIPVKDHRLLQDGEKSQIADTTCIVVFEYSEPHKEYLAILVEEISNVMAIAEKDASTAIVSETVTTDESGNKEFEYHLIATDNSAREKSGTAVSVIS